MRSYRRFILIFSVLLLLYIAAEMNRPPKLDWTITLSKDDKNPYGGYILYNQLKDVFPASSVVSLREPAYNLLHDNEITNAVYIAFAPFLAVGEADINELMKFAEQGNHVILSTLKTSELLKDTLGLAEGQYITLISEDSTSINFVNPALKAEKNYGYKRFSADEYFSKLRKNDSTTVLGITHKGDPNFVKVDIGKGAIYVHAAPLVFSNYSMLSRNNHEYVAKALSYIPSTVKTVYWDEYYKQGRTGPRSPLRFFLGNEWLRWALRLTIIALIIYVLFEMKRRQRIIPVIDPLRNTTIDFIKTVSSVYLSQKDNKSIAHNKIQYWLHFIRKQYYLQTNELNEDFVQLLAKRSGIEEAFIQKILVAVEDVQTANTVSDNMLLELNHRIDQFYTLSKT